MTSPTERKEATQTIDFVGNGTCNSQSPDEGEKGRCSEVPIILMLSQGCRELSKYRMKGLIYRKNIKTLKTCCICNGLQGKMCNLVVCKDRITFHSWHCCNLTPQTFGRSLRDSKPLPCSCQAQTTGNIQLPKERMKEVQHNDVSYPQHCPAQH